MNATFSILNLVGQLVDFLLLAAYIAGLVVGIVHRRASSSMILVIVGFGLEIGVWVLQKLAGAVFIPSSMEAAQVLQGVHLLFSVGNPIAIGMIAGGLYLTLADVRRRRQGGDDYDRPRRYRGEEDDRPAGGPRGPGSRDIRS